MTLEVYQVISFNQKGFYADRVCEVSWTGQ